jgi:intracellular sulfur oxidation DsrE/DsrF family protein
MLSALVIQPAATSVSGEQGRNREEAMAESRRVLRMAGVVAMAMVAWLSVTAAWAAEDGAKVHRLALQISDKDPQKMNTVLNVAANVSRYYSDLGQEVEVEVVAFNLGLHMLRADTSPIKERMQNYAKSMPNVKFMACANTLAAMTRKEGSEPPLFEFAKMVPAGVVRLMELDEQGWTIIRP